MSAPPTPNSPPSSHGSANLDLDLPPSPWPRALLGAWAGAACFAIAGCRACGVGGRVLLMAACAAALAMSVPRVLRGSRSVLALRRAEGRWWVRTGGEWRPAELERAVEVLRAGWWLQWRTVPDGRLWWCWVDERRTARAPYRALCRALQQWRGGVPARSADAGARDPRSRGVPDPRRRSRDGRDRHP